MGGKKRREGGGKEGGRAGGRGGSRMEEGGGRSEQESERGEEVRREGPTPGTFSWDPFLGTPSRDPALRGRRKLRSRCRKRRGRAILLFGIMPDLRAT